MTRINHLAFNIVNQLFDEAQVPVETRQRINDHSTNWVAGLIREFEKETESRVTKRCTEIIAAHMDHEDNPPHSCSVHAISDIRAEEDKVCTTA